jgi:hypothetical protein
MLRVFIAVPVTLVFLAMKGFFHHGLLTKVWKRARAPSDGLNHLLMIIFLTYTCSSVSGLTTKGAPEIKPHLSLEVVTTQKFGLKLYYIQDSEPEL